MSVSGSGTGADDAELDDAAQLTPLCEDSLLALLQARLDNDQIYTWAGTALLSVNPARPLPLYAPQLARRYLQGARRSPHLYSVAATAYRWARDLGKDQCIVFTGETGSGKSECVRICVQLAVVGATSGAGSGAEGGAEAGARLAAAGTLLESCSHAASNTHHNASRAGQKVEIDIDFKGEIVGTRVTQFLLNTECMVSRRGRERNFHAFYQLLAGADAATLKRLKLSRSWRQYRVLRVQDERDDDDDADDARASHDAAMFAHAMAAAQTLGREDWWWGVQRVLAFLMKLGNVTWERGEAPHTYLVVQYQELDEACSLVGIETGALASYISSFASSWQRGVWALSRAVYRRLHAAACTATYAEGRHATLTLLDLPGASPEPAATPGVDALLAHYVRTRAASAVRQACVCACLTADCLPSVTHAGLEQMLDAISSRAGMLPARMYEAGDMLERDREMLERRMTDMFSEARDPVFRELFSDKSYTGLVGAARALASSLGALAASARVVYCVRRSALTHRNPGTTSRLVELVSLHGCGWAECFNTEEFIRRYSCLIPRDQPPYCTHLTKDACRGRARTRGRSSRDSSVTRDSSCGRASRESSSSREGRRSQCGSSRELSKNLGGGCRGAGCGEGCAVRRAAKAARVPLGKVAVEEGRVFVKTTALVWQLEEIRFRRVRCCVALLQRALRRWREFRRKRAVNVISVWWLSVARASYLRGLAARLDARHLSPLCRAWPPPAWPALLGDAASLLQALHHRWRCLLYRRQLDQTMRNRFREKVTASALFLGRKASYPWSVGSWFAGDYVRLRAAGAWRRGAGARHHLVFADACASVGASGAARRALLALTTAALLLLSPRSLRARRTVACSRLAALAVSPYHDDLLCVVLDDAASSDESETCGRGAGGGGRCDVLLRVRRVVEACSKLVLVAQHAAAAAPPVAVAPAFTCRCPRPLRVHVHCAATPESRIVRRGDTLHVLPPD